MAGKSVAKTTEDVQVDEVETKTKAASKKKPAVKPVDLSQVTLADVSKMKAEYAKYRLEIIMGKQKDTAALSKKRKDIARAMTYLSNKK